MIAFDVSIACEMHFVTSTVYSTVSGYSALLHRFGDFGEAWQLNFDITLMIFDAFWCHLEDGLPMIVSQVSPRLGVLLRLPACSAALERRAGANQHNMG